MLFSYIILTFLQTSKCFLSNGTNSMHILASGPEQQAVYSGHVIQTGSGEKRDLALRSFNYPFPYHGHSFIFNHNNILLHSPLPPSSLPSGSASLLPLSYGEVKLLSFHSVDTITPSCGPWGLGVNLLSSPLLFSSLLSMTQQHNTYQCSHRVPCLSQ